MLSAISVSAVSAQRWMDSDHMDGWGWVMMGIVLLVVVVLILGLAYVVTQGNRRERSGADPLEVLDHRFARGEIDQEEYEKRRDVLRR